MRTQIVIPVFNEEMRLAACLPTLHGFVSRLGLDRWDITIANNGSVDGTREVAEGFCRTLPQVRLMTLSKRGRGFALRAAWSESEADVLAYMDVDLASGLQALGPLLCSVGSGSADIAIGSRRLPASDVIRSWGRELLSRGYIWLAKALCGMHRSDSQCGFKAISSQAARQLLPLVDDNGWFFDTELLIKAEWSGYRIAEIPVVWREKSGSRVRIIPTTWQTLTGLLRLRREARAKRRAASPTIPREAHPSPGMQ